MPSPSLETSLAWTSPGKVKRRPYAVVGSIVRLPRARLRVKRDHSSPLPSPNTSDVTSARTAVPSNSRKVLGP